MLFKRKNWLFAGTLMAGQRAAAITSLISSRPSSTPMTPTLISRMMDHPAHALNTDAYRRLSPFEQIPAIDDDGLVLSESAAILIYLARKGGKPISSDPPARRKWCAA